MWSESNRSRGRRDHDEGSRGGDDEEDWDEGSDRRKHRSGRSRRHGEAEEAEEQQDSAKRKGTGDRGDGRKKLGREDDGDDEDYDVRRESRSKLPKKGTDDRGGDRRSSDGYRDPEPETSGRKGRLDENPERDSYKKVSAKEADSQSRRSSSKVERGSHEGEHEKQGKDSKHSERKDASREKVHGSHEQEKTYARRRWDEGDPHSGKKTEESGNHSEKPESRSAQASDYNKGASSRDKAVDTRNEPEGKSKGVESSAEKVVIKSTIRDEKRRQEGSRDDKQRRDNDRPGDEPEVHRTSSRTNVDKGDKYKQQREPAHVSRDEEVRDKKLDDDGHGRMRDRGGRDIRPNRRSRTPDRRHHRESDDVERGYSESDNERGNNMKGKDRERDSYRDDRLSKGKDGGWNDRSREREPSKDHWRRGHMPRQDRDHRDGDEFDHDKDWDSKRREQEWLDNERHHGRPSYRKDNRSRLDSMRPSSDFGNANDHSDSIEIKPNRNLDFGREEQIHSYAGRRNDAVLKQQDIPSGGNDEEWGSQGEDRGKLPYNYVDDFQERYPDDGSPVDQTRRNSLDNYSGGRGRGQKPFSSSSSAGLGPGPNNGMQPPFGNNQGPGSMNRVQQGVKGGRQPRGGRGRMPGRDTQRVGLPIPMMGPHFGHLGMPPGPLQPMGPNMPPSPAPPMGPNVFIPPFPGPLVWPGARGIDINMLAVPPSLSPIPPGPMGPRFGPTMSPGPNHGMFFDQPNPGRGIPSNAPGPAFSPAGPVGRGVMHDKQPSGWTPNRSNAPAGKAPSRGEQNDYSQNFVDTGMRPQNFIRELELTSTVEDYPKLRELIQKKDEIVAKAASAPMYYKCDLREFVLSPEFFGTKFDVILVDPPWDEYVHRAPGVADHMEYWTFEEILNLKIEAIADTPSFIFLWVGDGVGLEQGRQCLKKWGFRRCEDICWVKTNKSNAAPSLRHDSHTLFQHSKEHCLMGIKGTVRRSTDGHIIHANIDTDIIIAEEPPYGSTKKPEDIYRIIEHFSLGRRRLELFGEDHNIRSGWLTVGKALSSSNFNADAYCRNFADKDGKVWQGGGGRNPPPEAPHLVVTTPDIESLRPKSPPQKNQQPQSTSLSTTANSVKRQQTGNSPQNPIATPTPGLSQEVSSANPPPQWGPSVLPVSRGSESGNPSGPDDNFFDGFGFNPAHGQTSGEHTEFEPHRTVNMM